VERPWLLQQDSPSSALLAWLPWGPRGWGWPGQPRSRRGQRECIVAASRQQGRQQCGFNLIVPKYCYNTNHVPSTHLQLISSKATE
jgi:hypothetical protein